MTLALSAILIVILLMPPLILHFFYKSFSYAKAPAKLSFLEYLFISSIVSLFIHTFIIYKFHLSVNYELILRIMSGNISEQFITNNIEKINLQNLFNGFSWYIFILCFCSAILGTLLALIATSRRLRMLDWVKNSRVNGLPPSFLRYYNSWWYFFRANEYYSKFNYLGKKKLIVNVQALVTTKECDILYSGFLINFAIKDDALDRIHLSNIKKKVLHKSVNINESHQVQIKESSEQILEPEGGILCIPYKRIKNLHVGFIALPTVKKKGRDLKKVNLETLINTVEVISKKT